MTLVKINNCLNVTKKIQTANLQIGDFIIKQDNDCLTISQDSHVIFTLSKNDPTIIPPFEIFPKQVN